MKLKDIMTRSVQIADPSTTLLAVANIMSTADVGAVPIVDEAGIHGLVTDRDLVVRGLARGLNPETTPVREVMTPGAVCVDEGQDAEDAARLMQQRSIRRLLVVSRSHSLVGIVSLGDLCQQPRERDLAHAVLDRVSEAKPQHVTH